jgi:aminomethyltransferase
MLKRPRLYEVHLATGALMVDVGGWEIPVQYFGPIEEHKAVRNSAGLFDVSHMGEIDVHGPEALKLVDHVTTNATCRERKI